MVTAVDPLDPRCTIAERRIDAGLLQIGRFEDVRVRRENERQHRHLLSAVKVVLESTRAEPVVMRTS
jgi:hypothetical protein